MAAEPRKFTFDQRFDDAPGRAGPAPKVKRFYTPEEVEAVRAETHHAIEARALQAQTMSLSQIAEAMMTTLRTLDQMAAEARAEALGVGLHAARRIADAALTRYPLDIIEQTITRCLVQVPHEPRIAVRVNPSVAEALKASIAMVAEEAGFTGRVVVMPDARTPVPDCRLEWTDGGVERDSAAIAARIDAVLERFIDADRRRADEAIDE